MFQGMIGPRQAGALLLCLRLGGTLDVAGAQESAIPSGARTASVQVLPTRVEDTYPSPSPDGKRIVFQSNRAGNEDIWIMNVDGSGIRRLTEHPALDETPVWSPDGESVLFASERDGELDVFRMRPDGSDVRNLTRNPRSDDDHPKFSPDGARIVFNSKRHDGETYQIWVMNADGTSPRRLTEHVEWDTYPSFSPDAGRILFRRVLPMGGSSSSGRNSEIFVMDANGGNVRNLSNHAAFDGYPDWSPDGRSIAFASNRSPDGRFHIYVMRGDGGHVVQVSPDSAGFSYVRPAWFRNGRQILANREGESSTDTVILSLPTPPE